MKRPFYILFHNPNRIGSLDDSGSALHALSHGANALAPHIVYIDKQFWVLHNNSPFESRKGSPTLSDYLAELTQSLRNFPSLQLHLIIFDLKHTNGHPFNFEALQKIIQDNFSSKISVPTVFTTPHNINFLMNEIGPQLTENQAAGTDEFSNPLYVHECFKWRGFPYVFAHGNSFFFHDVYKTIMRAVNIRDSGHSFRLVYPWVVNSKKNFKRYLELGVDAIMTSKPERLRKMIEQDYADKYEFKRASFGNTNLYAHSVSAS